MSALDILIRLLLSGQGETQKGIDDTGKSAGDLDKALDEVGDNDGLDKTGESAKGAGAGIDEATQKAEALSSKLETVRNNALAVAAGGAVVLALGDHLADGFVEADRLGGKLNSLMIGKGLDDGIEKVQELAGEIAGLTGGDDDGIATAIAGAVASGRLNSLREYGIVIDANGQAAIEAAGKISEQAKSQEILNQVLKAGGDATKNLRENMDASTATIGEWSVRVGNLEEGLGKGSAAIKAGIINNILSPILSVVEGSEGLQYTAGAVIEIGGAVASAGGSAVAFGAQAGQMVMGLQAMRAAKLAAAGADVVSAGAANANSVSQGVNALATAGAGTAAGASAVGHDVLAVSEGAAAVAANAEAVSVGVAGAAAVVAGAEAGASSVGHDVLAVSEGAAALAADVEAVSVGAAGAASVAGGAGAAAGSVGFLALAGSIWAACAPLIPFIALAGAAALAMYTLDKVWHAEEDDKLQKNIDAGNATNQARLDYANAQRRKRGQSEITVEQWQAMESDDENAISPESASKPQWKSGGEGSGAPSSGTPDLSQLQKMMEDAKSGAAMPTPAPAPAVATSPVVMPTSAPAVIVPPGAATLALPQKPASVPTPTAPTSSATLSPLATSDTKDSNDNAALRRYLENGGDVNQWDADGNKAGSATKAKGTDAKPAQTPSIKIPPLGAKATRVSNSKLRLDFTAPASIEIDDPLARALGDY